MHIISASRARIRVRVCVCACGRVGVWGADIGAQTTSHALCLLGGWRLMAGGWAGHGHACRFTSLGTTMPGMVSPPVTVLTAARVVVLFSLPVAARLLQPKIRGLVRLACDVCLQLCQ